MGFQKTSLFQVKQINHIHFVLLPKHTFYEMGWKIMLKVKIKKMIKNAAVDNTDDAGKTHGKKWSGFAVLLRISIVFFFGINISLYLKGDFLNSGFFLNRNVGWKFLSRMYIQFIVRGNNSVEKCHLNLECNTT